MKNIHIGNVTVPIVDYAVGASAVLGIRDSGKTVTSKGIAEQLLENHVPIVVFDAVGKWRWMKVAGEGKEGKAYKVVVAGGREPDLPLTPHSVPEIVRAALRERIPLVIDLFSKELSKADWRRIVQQAIHIIHYENEGGAVHVFLEEAAEFVPQKIYDGETYAEVEKLVRMGGNASVGITLINQRSQEVNKAVLDNCGTALVLGCQVGKNAIEAVEKWIDRLDPVTADEVTKSLPKLQSGEAWVWTRKSLDHPTREKMPMCRSFHPDRRTPEIILKSAKPTDTAEFVSKLASSIPKVIEEQKANDPAELKRTVAELKRKLADVERKAPEVKQERIEVPVFDAASRQLLGGVKSVCEEALKETVARSAELAQINRWLIAAQERAERTLKPFRQQQRSIAVAHQARPVNAAPASSRAPAAENGTLPKAERAILKVLANYPQGKSKRSIGVIAGYAHNGGGFNNSISALRAKGYIEGSEPLRITAAGADAFGPVEPLPTGEDLLRYWMAHPDLGRAEREVLRVLYEVNSTRLTKEQIAERTVSDRGTPYEANGGGFNNAISRLRTYELIDGRNELKLAEEFYE